MKFLSRLKLSTDHLWPLIILAGFGFFASLVPLPPNDFWWHLKIGSLIYTQHTVPTTNMFGWTLSPDTPFVYGAWLGELLLYLFYKLGNLQLVTFMRNILVVLALWLVGYETRRRSGSWRLAFVSIGLSLAMTLNNLVVRPQIWSWVPFMVYVIVLGKYASGEIRARWLLLCPLLMVFWVNAHGAFILGGVLVGVFFCGEALRTLLKQAGSHSWKEVGAIFGTGVLTGLAMLVNPRGIGIISYVIKLMTDKPSQRLIVEWQSPSPTGVANILFYLTILLILASLAFSRYRLNPTELLLIASFLWLAWSGQRYVVWFGMLCMPILMKLIAELPIKIPALTPQYHPLNWVIAIVLFIPMLLVQPWFVERIPLPQQYLKLVLRSSPAGPLVGSETPVDAVEYLKAHPGGHLFNEMGYGSYLIWAFPAQGVFIDPRVELYPYEQWQDYIRITNGSQYNDLFAHYGVDRIMLDTELQKELAAVLKKDPGWEKEYEDAHTQIWKKASVSP